MFNFKWCLMFHFLNVWITRNRELVYWFSLNNPIWKSDRFIICILSKYLFWITEFLFYSKKTRHAKSPELILLWVLVTSSPWQGLLMWLISQVLWIHHCLFLHYLALEQIFVIILDVRRVRISFGNILGLRYLFDKLLLV